MVVHIMEKLNKVDVVVGSFKVFLQKNVDRRFEEERVIDSNVPNTFLKVHVRS